MHGSCRIATLLSVDLGSSVCMLAGPDHRSGSSLRDESDLLSGALIPSVPQNVPTIGAIRQLNV